MCSLVNLLEFSSSELVATVDSKNYDNKENESNGKLNASGDTIDLSSEKNILGNIKTNDSFKVIPYFYHKLPKSTDVLAQKLREEARTLFLQKRSKELLDNNELKVLWNILQKNYTQPSINNEQFINYDDYMRVIKIAGDNFK